jgi:hypothetical protein
VLRYVPRHDEADEHDRPARHDVENEVVAGRDDREPHRCGHSYREGAEDELRRDAEHDDADEQVPAEVEARQCGVLVRQGRRLERTVRPRPLDHGVGEAGADQARRGDGEQREEGEPDRGRDQNRVPEQAVRGTPRLVEHHRGRGNHRPVAVDVDPVREGDERVVRKDRVLQTVLPVEGEAPLEPKNRLAVLDRRAGAPLGDGADANVGQRGTAHEHQLAKSARERAGRDRWDRAHAESVSLARGASIGANAAFGYGWIRIPEARCR